MAKESKMKSCEIIRQNKKGGKEMRKIIVAVLGSLALLLGSVVLASGTQTTSTLQTVPQSASPVPMSCIDAKKICCPSYCACMKDKRGWTECEKQFKVCARGYNCDFLPSTTGCQCK